MKSLTISLEDDIYERLCEQAQSTGVAPEEAAGDVVRRNVDDEIDAESIAASRALAREREIAALDRLREFRKGLPPIDVVQLIREGRDELEERAFRR